MTVMPIMPRVTTMATMATLAALPTFSLSLAPTSAAERIELDVRHVLGSLVAGRTDGHRRPQDI